MIGLKSQTKAIKDYLEAGNSITSMEAYDKFGCTRLSARIFDLKKAGYNSQTILMECQTRYGTTTRYAKYILIK